MTILTQSVAGHRKSTFWATTGLCGLIAAGLIATGASAQTAQTPPATVKPTTPAATPAKPDAAARDAATTDNPVIVNGTKPTQRIDRQVYDNKGNIDSATGTASDALNKVPSVNVDPNGNVTLRGANVQVYIDGKPSVMMQGDNRAAALQAMSSGDISSVEVMANPGAQYSSEGQGGIINLVMNKNRKPGASGAIIAAIGTEGRYNGSFTGSYRNNKITFAGGANYRHDGRNSNSGSILQQLDSNGQPTSTVQSGGVGAGTINNFSTNGSLDYNLGEKDTLSTVVNYSNRNQETAGDTIYAGYNAANAATSRYLRHSTSESPREDKMVGFTWNHTGDTAGETLKADLRFSQGDGKTDSVNDSTYTLPSASTAHETRHSSSRQNNGVFSLDYNRFVGADQLSTGLQITHDDNRYINTATGANAAGLTSDFAYEQTLYAAYVTYQKQFGDKWTVLGGVRSETLDLKTDLISSGTTGHIEYTKLSPSFFATYTLSANAKIRFSYAHRLQRPQARDLNPFVTYIDSQNVQAGNPNLKPQETDKFDLGYEYAKMTTSYQVRLYYQKNNHNFTSYSYFVSPGVLLTTQQNAGDSQSGGVEGNFNGKLTKKLSVNINGNAYYRELNTPAVTGTQSGTTISGRIGLSYAATPKDALQFSYFSSGKQLTGQGYSSPFMMGNLSYRHTFNPKTALVLTVNDPFRTGKFKSVTNTSTVHSEQVRSLGGQVIYLGLSYTLGGTPATPINGQQQQGPQGPRFGGGMGPGGGMGGGGPGGGM